MLACGISYKKWLVVGLMPLLTPDLPVVVPACHSISLFLNAPWEILREFGEGKLWGKQGESAAMWCHWIYPPSFHFLGDLYRLEINCNSKGTPGPTWGLVTLCFLDNSRYGSCVRQEQKNRMVSDFKWEGVRKIGLMAHLVQCICLYSLFVPSADSKLFLHFILTTAALWSIIRLRVWLAQGNPSEISWETASLV